MLNLDSKTGTAHATQEVVFKYLTDFRNFQHLLPAEKLNDVIVTENTIRFGLDGLGNVGLKIAEAHPSSQLIIKAMEGSPADFTFTIDLAESAGNTTRVNINLEARLNMFIEMMARSPLNQFLDLMIDKIETLHFDPDVTRKP